MPENHLNRELTFNFPMEIDMSMEKNRHDAHKDQMPAESESSVSTDQDIMDGPSEIYEQVEHAVSDAYDKTAKAVSETYEQTRNYSIENPGKTILLALGIGVGLGFLLGAGSRHSRTGRFAQPVVNALSDIALEFFH